MIYYILVVNITLTHIPFYYQTTLYNTNRHKHIEAEFSDVSLIRVHAPTPHPIQKHKKSLLKEKIISGALAQLRIIDMALRDQSKDGIFKPFALIEDDVSKYRKFPKTISIPQNTDILYIGISRASTIESPPYFTFRNFGYEINTHPYFPIVRIQHMLSTHGMLFCSLRSCIFHANAILESIHHKLNYDVILARTQNTYNIYALKEPLVYQNKNIGGLETNTKITLHKILPPELIPQTETITRYCSKTT